MVLSTQLISLGLIFHQFIYLSSKGLGHFSKTAMNFANIGQGKYSKWLVNVSLFFFSLLLVLYPESKVLQSGTVISLFGVILFFPNRIPNHLPLALFSLCIILFVNDLEVRKHALQSICCILYFFVAFHKLNSDYFKKNLSVGYGVTAQYLMQRFGSNRYIPEKILYFFSVPLIVIIEAIVFLFLFLNINVEVAIILALVLHFAFGYLAHYHFSTIMLGLLASFFGEGNLVFVIKIVWSTYGILPFFLATLTFFIFSNHRIYNIKIVSLLGNFLFSVIFWFVALFFIIDLQYAKGIVLSGSINYISFVIIFLTFLNGISPYIGLKNDFSFAMFSNLHPYKFTHFIFPYRLFGSMFVPRYYMIDSIRFLERGEKNNFFSVYNEFLDDISGEYIHIRILSDLNSKCVAMKIDCEVTLVDYLTREKVILNDLKLRLVERFILFPSFLPRGIATPYYL